MSKLTVNGKEYDLLQAVPLTLGDWRKLEKAGVTTKTFEAFADGEVSMSAVWEIFALMLRKLNPEIADEDIDSIPMDEATMKGLFGVMSEGEGAIASDPS